MISPTVNFSYTPDQGWTWIETYVSGRIFSDNGNYLVNGAQTLSQKPILRLEHLSRNVTDGFWLSLDAISAEKRALMALSRTIWRTR